MFSDAEHLYLVFEYCDCDLSTYLKRLGPELPSEELVRNLMRQFGGSDLTFSLAVSIAHTDTHAHTHTHTHTHIGSPGDHSALIEEFFI